MVKRMGFFCFCTCLCVLWIFAKAETWVVNTSRTRPEFCTWMAIAFLHYNHHPSRVQSFFLDMKLILLFSFFLLWSFSETLFKAVKKFVFFFRTGTSFLVVQFWLRFTDFYNLSFASLNCILLCPKDPTCLWEFVWLDFVLSWLWLRKKRSGKKRKFH